MKQKILAILRMLGPGLIIAAVVLGPGSISSISANGSIMGARMLWLLVLCGAFMLSYTVLAARFGAMNGKKFLTHLAERYGRWLSVVIGICAFTVCAGFQGGNNIGVGMAMSTLLGGTVGMWAVVFTVLSIAFMFFFRKLYQAVEKLMMGLVVLMILAFAGNLLVALPEPSVVLRGLVPSWPEDGNVIQLVAIVSTTFSVMAALFQAYLVQEKNWGPDQAGESIRDSVVGIFALSLISIMIMLTAATVLFPKGIKVTGAADMAVQLEPLLGRSAKWLFCAGLWGASFSSFLGNAVLGGTILSDGLGLGGGRVESLPTKIIGTLIMLIGMSIAIITGGRQPVEMIIVLQAAIIIAVPLTAFFILKESNSREVMGEATPSWWLNLTAVAGLVAVLFLAWKSFERIAALIGNG
ncbi:Nramp family divalent metal transporter [bacterium]|nr:Nramp family divalent metal transporter [bacterium]